ncbi:MAG: porin family protein [Bacteroidota bacterium]
MKKYLLIIGFVLIGITAQSQVIISLLLGDKLNSPNLEFGLEGGFNYTNISGFESSEMLRNFNLGFYFDIKVKNQWYFYTGVQVKSSFGLDDLTQNDLTFLEWDMEHYDGNYKQKVNAFMVPILANYKFKNHFYVEAGPQLGLVYNSWIQFDSDENHKETRIKDYNRGLTNWINGGLAGGFGYKLQKGKGMTIGVRYYQALTNVLEDTDGSINNSFHIKVNIPIGAGKVVKNGE